MAILGAMATLAAWLCGCLEAGTLWLFSERWPVPTAAVGRLRRIAALLDAWCVVVAPGRWGQPRRPGVSGAPDRGAQVCL
ncbi:hypothetical protein KBY72_06090 [Cyanobium sp. BA5m-21]|uniref:hypothetical protein n=1 Tax=Cyanobium sp. BA5m-21 TaxID=2823706 RepID=UPI0020CF53EF|nr:hypothetical protein [Cyanobium sp. BA5m-21]MCP9906750.1 hypothetical protein [Cyanobium sp. BA5m-21]